MEFKIGHPEYKGRGIHKLKFFESLENGALKKMIEVISKDSELDIQVRKDYLNIYYKGGNIARVKSENSIEFDKFYFYLDMETTPKKEVEKNIEKVKELKIKRDNLVRKFKKGDYRDYFAEAKDAIDKWLSKNSKPERMQQHNLSTHNHYNQSDYTIIDLEYQVSTKSDFACTHRPQGKDKPKNPRFDIIAINKKGKLCVIEFKVGTGALKNTSGLKEHWDCYSHSIGSKPKPFMHEMKVLLEQKQTLNLIEKQVKIKCEEPEFMFAFAYDCKKSIKEQEKRFQEEYRKIGKPIHVIRLKQGTYSLLD